MRVFSPALPVVIPQRTFLDLDTLLFTAMAWIFIPAYCFCASLTGQAFDDMTREEMVEAILAGRDPEGKPSVVPLKGR